MRVRGALLLAVPAAVAAVALIGVPVLMTALQPLLGGDARQSFEYLDDVGVQGAFVRGAAYAISSLCLQFAVGASLAYCVWRRRMGSLVSAVLTVPYFISTMCVVLVFKLFLDPSDGAAAQLGLPVDTSSLFTAGGIFWLVVGVSVWQFYPFVYLSMLGGLRTVPHEAVDCVLLDGGGALGLIANVLWPRLRHIVVATVVLRALWMFTKIDTVYLIAGDSLLRDNVETAPVLAYRLAFHNGMLSAASMVSGLLLISLLPIPFVGQRTIQYSGAP